MSSLAIVENSNRIIDFDLYGIVGIRLIDASSSDVAAVSQQVGEMQSDLVSQPDLIIRFVNRIPIDSEVRYLGLNKVGYTDEFFLIAMDGKKVKIPIDQVGRPCEIECETGLSSIPLLGSIINLIALGKDILPLHASAFIFKGQGVAVSGWSRGGKTGMLLAFMSAGAQFVGDDWVYINHDGNRMYGVPGLMQVREWYLKDLPVLYAKIDKRTKTRLQIIKTLRAMNKGFLSLGVVNKSTPGKIMRRLGSVLEQQQRIDLFPHQLFGLEACKLEANFEKLFLVVNHENPNIVVEKLDPQDVIHRVIFALQDEWADLMTIYLKYQFAFPKRQNDLIERIKDYQLNLLSRALSGKKTFIVSHPYPVSALALFKAVSPFLQDR